LLRSGQVEVAAVAAGVKIRSATGTCVSASHLVPNNLQGATTARATSHGANHTPKGRAA
jgi:hypothetical protein